MPIAKQGAVSGMTNYYYATYDTSMKMPTYLLAIVISDYTLTEYEISPVTKTAVRVAAPQETIDQDRSQLCYKYLEMVDVWKFWKQLQNLQNKN